MQMSKECFLSYLKEGATTWDLFEILQVDTELELREILKSIFDGYTPEYVSYLDQINLNNYSYSRLHISPPMTISLLESLIEEKKMSKIAIMRIFGITNPTTLYTRMKRLFQKECGIKKYQLLKRKMTHNTTTCAIVKL